MPVLSRRRALAWAAGTVLMAMPWVSRSQEPTIRIVVPFPAGGSADQVARLLAPHLSKRLNAPVIIDNKPGADGAIAASHVASSAPDGRTLLLATYGAISALPYLHAHLAYQPEKDLTPLAHMGEFSMMLFANPDLGAKRYIELREQCQRNSIQCSYGTGNVASIVMGSWLNHHWSTHMTPVPYKGEVPAIVDLLAGRIQWMFATPTNTLGFVREGRLVAMAHVSSKRHVLAPAIPSWRELGLEPFAAQPWGGIMGPAGLSESMTLRIHQAINACLTQETSMVHDMQLQGFDPQVSRLDSLPAWLRIQSHVWEAAIVQSGLSRV